MGLGKITLRSHLGEPLLAEVEVLASGKDFLDSSCFQLRFPDTESELPWLRRGTFHLRRGASSQVEIRTTRPVNEPVVEVGVLIGCGHEVRRDYTLLLSPRGMGGEGEMPAPAISPPTVSQPAVPIPPPPQRRRTPLPTADTTTTATMPAPARPRREKPLTVPPVRNRVVVSRASDLAEDPLLRMTTELPSAANESDASREVQRSILRLEFRMMMALQELTASQAGPADKLRTLQAALGEPQQAPGNVGQQAGKGPDNAGNTLPPNPAAVSAPQPSPPMARPAAGSDGTADATSPQRYEWAFYGGLLGALLVIGAWLAWRQYRQRYPAFAPLSLFPPTPMADPIRQEEREHLANDGFTIEPTFSGVHATENNIDVSEIGNTPGDIPTHAEPEPPPTPASAPDIPAVDHQFEVQPILELAEIMMSFGRTKGAAQVLQEYIEQKPTEALQPWIRLMEVYREADMREDFERLVQDLHRHFNVEVQRWAQAHSEKETHLAFSLEPKLSGDGTEPPSAPVKPQTLEEFSHIRDKLIEVWATPECLNYLHYLLRDNRDGQRSGFPLQVVNEILFLIELLEIRTAADAPGDNAIAITFAKADH